MSLNFSIEAIQESDKIFMVSDNAFCVDQRIFLEIYSDTAEIRFAPINQYPPLVAGPKTQVLEPSYLITLSIHAFDTLGMSPPNDTHSAIGGVQK